MAALALLLLALSAHPETACAETAAVAKVGETEYLTLDAAVAAAEDGDTVVVLQDTTSDRCVDIPENISLSIDFSKCTYELCDGESSDDESSFYGFSVPFSSDVAFNNGTIRVEENADRVRGAISSLGDVSFNDMNIVGGSYMATPLIDLIGGTAVFSGATNIVAQSPDALAFYVKHWGANAPSKGIHVNFDESYTGTVSASIVYLSNSSEKATLEVHGNGHFYSIALHSWTTVQPSISVFSGVFTLPSGAAEGLEVVSTPDGEYTVVPADKVKKVIFDYAEDFDYDTGQKILEVKVEEGTPVRERELHDVSGYQVFWRAPDGSRYDFTSPVTDDMVLTASKILQPIEVELEVVQTTPMMGDVTYIFAYPYSEAPDITYSYAWYKDERPMDVDSDVSSLEVSEGGTYGVIVTARDLEGNMVTSELTEVDVVYTCARMHRLYNRWTGEHLYTASAAERDSLEAVGWAYEGVGWVAPAEGADVYRLYNPFVAGGDHHYTLDASERDALVSVGWSSEGTGWRSAPAGSGVPLFRQYNPYAVTGTHNYTADASERDALVEVGWRDEGIAWYGIGS